MPALATYVSEFDDPSIELFDATQELRDGNTAAAVASLRAMWVGGLRSSGGVAEAMRSLMSRQPWPVFTVELAAGEAFHAVWRNLDGDGGHDLLIRSSGDVLTELARIDGHFRWPGLSWREMTHVLQRTVHPSPAEALHVLLPFVGGQPPAEAVSVIAAAMTSASSHQRGVTPEQLVSAMTVRPSDGRWDEGSDELVWTGLSSHRGAAGIRLAKLLTLPE